MPSQAETLELELIRPDGRSFAYQRLAPPKDGDQVVIPDGDRAWSVSIDRHEYEGRLRICADLSRWVGDGDQAPITRPCVTLDGRETPEATVYTRSEDIHVRMTVKR